ncbi:RHS repeat-associated core domain-containing protein, partial [bacterium]|nr:RHS repeat-associated core domain-containing protein [bacterium]
RDAETGLDYMLARYYASSAGAFLTVDPLDASAKAADPLSWNRYAYVRGNPLNRVDPTGEEDGDTSAEPEKKKELSDNGQGGAASLQDDLKEEQQESAPLYDKDHVKPAPPTPESVKIMKRS